nr:bone marrow proteoglycan-like [Pelodiscus sinensis]|eukprot:XP_006120979.1 bone marrow proteoglycan-like [Pelodiscus sinensis]
MRLRCKARANSRHSDVWIGGKASRRLHWVRTRWTDRSNWDYSNWVRGYPRSFITRCVSMCTANGQWRCLRCITRLPFICEY